MPWQQLVADVGSEVLPSGLPAFREIVVTIHRQAGKTTECLAFELDRGLFYPAPQHIGYSAQTGLDARSKIVKDQWPLIAKSPLRAGVSSMLKGAAYTAIEFKNGSRIEALASSEESGHGKTMGLGVIDEAFADEDDRREQALGPAMITKADAQKLVFSTAGTEKSVFLKRKVDMGRQAVASGMTEGIAYFEWSAPDDADIENPATWWECMPALGYSITEDAVRAELHSMSENEFRRAYMNQWTATEDRVIPKALWDTATGDHKPDGRLFLAADTTPMLTNGSIVVCDGQGRAELVKHTVGVKEILPELIRLAGQYEAPVGIDTTSTAAPMIRDLQAAGVEVVSYSGRDLANACVRFMTRLADGLIHPRSSLELTAAVENATQRIMGDSWAWGRKQATVDISPLVALTLAVDMAVKGDEPDGGPLYYPYDG